MRRTLSPLASPALYTAVKLTGIIGGGLLAADHRWGAAGRLAA
ncbi:hypothetical protein ACPXB1_10590 [Micromonospora sp. DT68]